MKIVDIGAAPGGWLQFASKIAGSKGRVIGIDIKEIEPILNVIIINGNVEDEQTVTLLSKYLEGKADDPSLTSSYFRCKL